MNKLLGKRFLCVFLCAVLLLSCMGTAVAAGKKKAEVVTNSLAIFNEWYYVPSSLPQGTLIRSQPVSAIMGLYSPQGDLDEIATSVEITYKKGDESLLDAFSFDASNGHLTLDDSKLTAPGQVTYRVKAESENLIYEKDYTLVVLDYSENPLFSGEPSTEVRAVENGYSFRNYEAMELTGFTANTEEIIARLKQGGVKMEEYAVAYSSPEVMIPDDVPFSRAYIPYPYRDIWEFTVNGYGEWEFFVNYALGNVLLEVPVRFRAEGVRLVSSGNARPGEKVQYTVDGTLDGRSVAWSLEGDGADLDQNGLLSIHADAAPGSAFTVTALVGDDTPLTAKVILTDGLLSDATLSTVSDQGFTVPYPDNYTSPDFPGIPWIVGLEHMFPDQTKNVYYDARFYLPDAPDLTAENPEVATGELEADVANYQTDGVSGLEWEFAEVDGHPALLFVYSAYDTSSGEFLYHEGQIRYIRNNRYVRIRLRSQPVYEGASAEETPVVTLNDMRLLVSRMDYNVNGAPFSLLSAAITLSAKDGVTVVTAGKQLQIEAAFADPDQINQSEKNNGITWSVVDAATGGETDAATITNRGQLKVNNKLEAPVELEVRAVSDRFGTEASLRITALPQVKAVKVEPAELFFYTGTDTEQTVKVVLDPDTVPLVGITWTPAKDGIVEIIPKEDGVVGIRPVGSGKTTVAVKEPGGKNARLNISIVEPVTAVTLTVKGNARPGGNVTVSAALEPKQAGNKNLEWALDVGEDIATVNERGQVKISKEAPVGTVITVTCRALGAPEPISAETKIEVVEK